MIGVRTDHGEGFQVSERQSSVVLEQSERLPGGLECDGAVRLGPKDLHRTPLRIGMFKQSAFEFHAEQMSGSGIEILFGEDSAVESLEHSVRHIRQTAFVDIASGLDRPCGGLRRIRGETRTLQQRDRAPVGDHKSPIPQLSPQQIGQQPAASGTRQSVQIVVCAHDGSRPRADRLPERTELTIVQFDHPQMRRRLIVSAFRTSVRDEMLQRRHDPARLQSAHHFRSELSGQERILGKILLDAGPARLAGDVQNRSVDRMNAGRARLFPDHFADAADQCGIPASPHSQSGREHAASERHESMRRLLRQIERNAQTRMVQAVFLEQIDHIRHPFGRDTGLPVARGPPVGAEQAVQGADRPALHRFTILSGQRILAPAVPFIGLEAVEFDDLSDLFPDCHASEQIFCADFRTQRAIPKSLLHLRNSFLLDGVVR